MKQNNSIHLLIIIIGVIIFFSCFANSEKNVSEDKMQSSIQEQGEDNNNINNILSEMNDSADRFERELHSMTKEQFINCCEEFWYDKLEDEEIGKFVRLFVCYNGKDEGMESYVDASRVDPSGGFQIFYTVYQFRNDFIIEREVNGAEYSPIFPVYEVYGILGEKSKVRGSGHRNLYIYPVYMYYLGDLADYKNGKFEEGYVEPEESLQDLSPKEFKDRCKNVETGAELFWQEDDMYCVRAKLTRKRQLAKEGAGEKLALIDDSDFTYSQVFWDIEVYGMQDAKKKVASETVYFANEGNAKPDKYKVGKECIFYLVINNDRYVVVYVE